jgi:hypothetical protein
MHDVLRKCIDNFGEPPRAMSLWNRLTYCRVPKPDWLRSHPTDKLRTHFENLKTLFSEGVVVWGHIIQANSLMFEKGPYDCPGELVYSIEDSNRVEPEYLERVAKKLFSLKGTKPDDPELQPIADYLTDERIRVFGLPVPSSISPSIRCVISTTYFVRKHLPERRLCAALLPLVVNRQEPYTATVLPERYWPLEFVEWWSYC